MTVICIGGICVPYTAIAPLLFLGAKWLAVKLASLGLLPPFLAKHLGLTTVMAASKETPKECSENETRLIAPSKLVHSIESMDNWTSAIDKHQVLVIKFTAEWCWPCKDIEPNYEQLSEKYEYAHFVEVNVNEIDELVAEHSIADMRTFVVIEKGSPVSSLCGSSPHKVQDFCREHLDRQL